MIYFITHPSEGLKSGIICANNEAQAILTYLETVKSSDITILYLLAVPVTLVQEGEVS